MVSGKKFFFPQFHCVLNVLRNSWKERNRVWKNAFFPGNIVTFPTISYVFLYVKSQNFPPSCQISHESHYQITLFFPTMRENREERSVQIWIQEKFKADELTVEQWYFDTCIFISFEKKKKKKKKNIQFTVEFNLCSKIQRRI